MNAIVLSVQQARELAMAIFSDIEEYVNANREEFEEFLRAENEFDNIKGAN